MKTVITYGTFDLFHVGHIRLLKRLRSLGDKLIVAVSTDEFNQLKGKKSFFSYEERAEILSSCKYVDEVIPENCWSQKRSDILSYNIDIFAMGDDWQGEFDELNDVCKVVYFPRTPSISTTSIKTKLAKMDLNKLNEVESSLLDVLDIIKAISMENK